jgi:hypothetical protein
MQVLAILQGESLTRVLKGAFAGFLATVIVGPGDLGKHCEGKRGGKCSYRRRGGSGPDMHRQIPTGPPMLWQTWLS